MRVSEHATDHAALADAHRIGVYGLGREGQSIVGFLRRAGIDAPVDVLVDGDPDVATRTRAAELDVELVAGRQAVVDHVAAGAVDVVVRSPGVPLRGDGLTAARRGGIRVTSGTNLWFEANAPDNVVAITGTKGKSTTSALLAHLLRATGRDVALLGNIGMPLLDHDRPAHSHDVVVVELSSYQLADLHQPIGVGVWLNLHHEHLDWHGSHAAYVRDKGRVVELSGTLVANAADATVAAAATDHPDVVWVDASDDPVRLGRRTVPRQDLEASLRGSPLVGGHHVGNLACALAAGTTVGASPESLLPHVASFDPLPHRLELVHDDGRRWVDDSISTIPEAAVAALRAFPGTPVTLLAGGFDREQDHGPLVDEVVARGDVLVVALPDTGARLATDLRNTDTNVVEVADLDGAVAVAAERTPAGGVVLLSPAAPSYGHFASFEDRGDQFAALARTASEPRQD